MVTMATEVQQTHQEDHHEVHPHGEQDGSQDLEVLLHPQLPPPPENSGHGEWGSEWSI